MTEVITEAPAERETMVVPGLGLLVERSPRDAAHALDAIRSLEEKLREAKRLLSEILIEEATRLGVRTFRMDDIEVEVRGGREMTWDVTELERLRELGLPQERYEQLVKTVVTYKVSALEAKRIAAANPAYAEVIERARREETTPQYVRVRRAS